MDDPATILTDIATGEIAEDLKPLAPHEADALVTASMSDPGAPYLPSMLSRLRATKEVDLAAYMRLRDRLKKDARVPIGALEQAMMGKGGNFEGSAEGQGKVLQLRSPEPWQDAVDGDLLLSQLIKTIQEHVILSRQSAVAVALWVIHTYCYELFFITPRLQVSSPMKRCGKSKLLDLIYYLSKRAMRIDGITAASAFRTIESHAPTLVIDEADTFMKNNEDLRGIVNSGYASTGAVMRVVGDHHEPRIFSTFAPMAIAAIGALPGTIEDRSIKARMRRRLEGETVVPLRVGKTEHLEILARRIARWISDHVNELRDTDPVMPKGLHDRMCDNWFALFAIADAIGGEWPQRAREAAQLLAAESDELDDQAFEVMLLQDMQRIFAHVGDRIASTRLIDRLLSMPDRPWGS